MALNRLFSIFGASELKASAAADPSVILSHGEADLLGGNDIESNLHPTLQQVKDPNYVRRLPLHLYPQTGSPINSDIMPSSTDDCLYQPPETRPHYRNVYNNIPHHDALIDDEKNFARDFPWRYFAELSDITELSWKDLYIEQYEQTYHRRHNPLCDIALEIFKCVKSNDFDALQRQQINFDLLSSYESKSANGQLYKTPLYYAQVNNRVEMLNWFYEQTKQDIKNIPEHTYVYNQHSIDKRYDPHQYQLDTIGWAVACRQPIPLIETLIDSSSLDREQLKHTLLKVASISGHTELVLLLLKEKKLIRYGEPKSYVVNARSTLAGQAVSWAAQYGHLELIKSLHAHGADLNSPIQQTYYCLTPIHLACLNGDLNCFEYILYSNEPCNLSEIDDLIINAVQHNNLAIVNALLSLDEPLIIEGFRNNTPKLMHACVIGNDCEMLQLLEYHGVDINPMSSSGNDDIPDLLTKQPYMDTFLNSGYHPYIIAKYQTVMATLKDESWYSRLMRS